MEGIVAKRSLKKSYYNGKKNNIRIEKTNENISGKRGKFKNTSLMKFSNYKSKILYKMSLQSITVISILIFILGIKFFNITVVKEADITKKIIIACNKNYSINEVKNQTKNIFKKSYSFIKPVIPSKIKEKANKFYKSIMKNENNKNIQEVIIYEESNTNNQENKENKIENIEAIGTNVENEEQVATASSSVSSEFNMAEKIKKTNVKFIKPLTGVITSHFGAREVIFEGVDSYHTGTDIAATSGTSIVSSIEGKVTVASYNKYNGNYVEVTNGKIVTKYLHMSKITVKKGVKIKAGEKIGEVGSTGLATGPHLHFEIVYDGIKVDPELILSL